MKRTVGLRLRAAGSTLGKVTWDDVLRLDKPYMHSLLKAGWVLGFSMSHLALKTEYLQGLRKRHRSPHVAPVANRGASKSGKISCSK